MSRDGRLANKRSLPFASNLRMDSPATKTIYVSAGTSAWRRAREWSTEGWHRQFVVLPPDANPAEFRWAFAAGKELVVLSDGLPLERLDEIAVALALAKSTRILVVTPNRIIPYRVVPPVPSHAGCR